MLTHGQINGLFWGMYYKTFCGRNLRIFVIKVFDPDKVLH
jgi:hypothetical protein